MGKTYIDTIKYMIKGDLEIDGIVERPDVVGAIFGQTEGLLTDEMDLRELLKSGRIGRIEVDPYFTCVSAIVLSDSAVGALLNNTPPPPLTCRSTNPGTSRFPSRSSRPGSRSPSSWVRRSSARSRAVWTRWYSEIATPRLAWR